VLRRYAGYAAGNVARRTMTYEVGTDDAGHITVKPSPRT
jgi:hypothetical protein